jgi:ABC-type transport system involved in Fe-S cluster assembly fused permease/ATPase subunit
VAIARTLLKNPCGDFDETTSALDSANERAIQAGRSRPEQDHALVIAHRLSTVDRRARDSGDGPRPAHRRARHAPALLA